MLKKLPKELVEKLTQEDLETISNVFNSEAKQIRESSTNGMISKKEYEALSGELNSLKKGAQIDKLIYEVPEDLKDLFKDKLVNAENVEEAFNNLYESKKGLIEKLKEKEAEPADVASLAKPTEAKKENSEKEERKNAGLPVI